MKKQCLTRLQAMGLAACLLAPALASAHGFAGKRFFPATPATDDPFVADELSLPTISQRKLGATDDAPATTERSTSIDFTKRITSDFGVGLGASYLRLAPEGGDVQKGFDNFSANVKYQFYKNDAREAIASVGVDWDIGGSGQSKVGAESFSTWTPAIFVGKGFGDLPDSVEFARPLALTGALGVAIPSRHSNRIKSVEENGSVTVEREVNPTVFQWGFTVQYNLQYLQSYVRDVGLPRPFSRMIPIVELAMETPLDGPRSGRHTTGTVNPGIIWFGRYIQLGLEAVIPVNERSGKNVGVVGQVHFYLDDLWPQIFTWTPFHGVLGPTQPR